MREARPNPDALLREIQRETSSEKRGKLKVFLGASAGVGKTYAMLSEAHEERARGRDVLVGYVETHGRTETQALTEGLEVLPEARRDYRGIEVKEFDLDGALARRPALILVDELAHTNVPESRHPKRWQDVEELLDAGIDVYTAVNVQHLESLNDTVAQITGVVVKETVPDSVVERADAIKVVDIPPEALRQRLKEGKVYVPDRIDHALEGFFKVGNLMALREMALRRAADRVDAEMRQYRTEQGVTGLWPTRERVLVCVAPNRLASRVVRAAARMAAASHAEPIALVVESDRQCNRPEAEHEAARQALRLAESLGMETASLSGHDIAGEILAFARRRNVNLVVVGKPIKARWREILFGSVVDELVRHSGEIDVHVITGAATDAPKANVPKAQSSVSYVGYAWTLGVVASCTVIGVLLRNSVDPTNLAMLYLLGVTFVASRFGRGEAILASVLSAAVFDVALIPPFGTLAVSDAQYLITLAAMLLVALVVSRLALRLHTAADSSAERERRTAALYSLSRRLARSRSKKEIVTAGVDEIGGVFETEIAIFGREEVLAPSPSGFEEEAVARWTLDHDESAGRSTDTLPGSRGLYLPLRGGTAPVGVLAFLPREGAWPLSSASRDMLETFANSLGLALERVQLAKESHESRVQAESERTRNALLASISHDLRTPLTSIAGAASALVERGEGGDLAETIVHESLRLNLQVQNLLDMTRLQSGEMKPRLEWNSLEEIIGAALSRSRPLLEPRIVEVHVPPALPLIQIDGELVLKLFVNLFENAAHHTPPETRLTVTASEGFKTVRVVVADDGPGIAKGQETAIFERFAQGGVKGEGLGLGLAICRAIMRLHQGVVWGQNRVGGGAEFHVEFPRPTTQPEVPVG